MTALWVLLRPLLGPLAPMMLAGAAALAMLAGAYATGYRAALRKAQVASLRAELAAARVDLSIARATADAAARDEAEARQIAAAQDERIRAYEREIASRPAGACRLDERDIRRLRGLAR